MKYLFPCVCVVGAIFIILNGNPDRHGSYFFAAGVLTFLAALAGEMR